MRISFDLDDTLVGYRVSTANEPRLPWHARLFAGHEPLRLGAPWLIRELQARGWEVCISPKEPLMARYGIPKCASPNGNNPVPRQVGGGWHKCCSLDCAVLMD